MDRKDFDELIEKHERQVINLAYRFLNNHPDAEDIAQEVFLKAYKALPEYEPMAKYSTYLYKITKNLCLNYLRRKKLVHFFSLDSWRDDPDSGMRDFPDKGSIEASKMLEEKELKDKIYEALNKLPLNQRTAVILKRYENLNLDEIGDVLGISLSAVKSLLHRAKLTLRKELSDYL